MSKKMKKLQKKYLIRRIFCIAGILIFCTMLFMKEQINKKAITEKSAIIKNSYNIEITKKEVDELYNKLNIINTELKWADDIKKGNNPNQIVLHHSAIEDISIQDVHQKHIENGWSGIGYHYFIKKDGKIYKGREEDIIGAHVENNNLNNIGVCLEGNFEKEELTKEQELSILNLLKYLVLKYNIKELRGHRDLGQTLCPGENIKVTNIKNKLDTFINDSIEQANNGK